MEKNISQRMSIKCPDCGCLNYMVKDSRNNKEMNYFRRRRVCMSCGCTYTTYEVDKNTMNFFVSCIKELDNIHKIDPDLINNVIKTADEIKAIGKILGGVK